MADRYDVIIIGSGAGGGTLFHALAPTGKRILLLERGGYVPREKDNWSTRAVNVDGKYNTKEIWRDAAGRELHPHTNYWVGGNTKFYGAALFRMRREDFGELKHAGGVSPAWPITYDDLEPYYTRAERLYHVHGERGADPTETPASAPYPHPPVSHEPRIQQLADDFARQGLRPFPVPLGIMLDERQPQHSPCIRCRRATAIPASSAPNRMPRSCVSIRRSRIRTRRCSPTHPSSGCRRARRGARSRACSFAVSARSRNMRPTSSWSRPALSTRRRCCCARRTIAIRGGSPTARASWDGTTWATSTRS